MSKIEKTLPEKIDLRDLTYSELEDLVCGELGEPKFRTKQIYGWLYKGADGFEDMTDLSKSLRGRLAEMYKISRTTIRKKFISKLDGTRRYLLELEDGNLIESVLMSYHHGYTICISSQVGCAMGCAFCASTRNGKVRNLTPGEIIGQILAVQRDEGVRISNIVMMGVGEPLDNFDNVMKFLDNVTNPNGLNIGARHITISTCGLVDRMKELADKKLQITLAVSLHATDDKKRSAIMPINKRYSIAELLEACRYYTDKTHRRLTFEYTLIAGVNDSTAEAERLARLLKGLLCHVNLIPVNNTGAGFRPSDMKRVERFRERIERSGISATVRRELGSDISAACGQLRNAGSER